MVDWGDSDEDLDLDALDQAEQHAVAQRQAQPATALGPLALCAAPAQQQTEQRPRKNTLQGQPQPAPPLVQQRNEGPPRNAAELCRRCNLFRSVPSRPQRPTHDKCPGVYGRGCGGGLQLVRWGDGHTPFWACSKPECAYREFPPPCKLAPELTILLERRCNTLAVGAAPGAEEAVAWCGGVAAVLQAAGVDLRRALSAPVQAPTQAAAAAPAPAPPKAASAPPDEPAAQPAGGRPSSAGCGTVGGVLMRPGSSHGMAAAAGDAPEAIFPGRAPTAGATATAVDAQEAAKQVTAAERLAATHTAAGAAPLTACEQAPHGPRVLPHSQAAAQHTSTTEMATAEHTVSAQPLAAAQRDAPEQQQHAAAQHEHSDSALSPPAAAAQADVQPAAGVVGPTKAPGLQQPPEAARPRPVIFPLHEYERLSAQLKQFERQFGVCLVGQQGLVPQATLKAARGQLRTLPAPPQAEQLYARMPPSLERALLPFQREGVRYGLAHGGRCLIADEMGVGKTVQAIALASCYQDEWPLLIVVPASLRLVWAEELERWLPHLRPSRIHVIEGKEHRVAQGSVPLVCITSYEMMQRLTCDACKARAGPHASMCAGQRPPCADPMNCMASLRWRVVVVDESHTLRTSSKPPDALHTEAVTAALRLCRRAIMLTGTPSLSRPFDLFRQVDAIVPGLLGRNRIEFAAAYCNRHEVPMPGCHAPGERRTRMDVSGLSRGAELHDMLKAEVMLRRLKKDVLSQLPPKRRQVIRLPKPPASEWPKLPKGRRRHADDSEGSASDGDEDEVDGGEEEAAQDEDGSGGSAKPMSAAHRTGLAKCSSVIDWLMTALGVRSGGRGGGGAAQRGQGPAGGRDVQNLCKGEDDEEGGSGGSDPTGCSDAPKFLVFAHHKTVMNRLAAALEGATGYAPVSYVRIDGSTDPEDRRMAVRRFRSDASVRVALLSVTAAGVGLDFSSASVVVFVELPDEVALVRQAEDRAHRQGQSQPVNVYFLCAKGTTDDRRWQALNRSLARVAAVHDGAGLRTPVTPAAHAAGCGGPAVGRRDEDSDAQAVPGGCRRVGRTPQAGLAVECVYDAEAAGLTQAAAMAGQAAGLERDPRAGQSPTSPAGESAAGAAADTAPRAAAPCASTAAARAQRRTGGGVVAAQAPCPAKDCPEWEPGSPAAAAPQAPVFAAAGAAAGAAVTPLLAVTPPGLAVTPAGAELEAPASSFVAATDEPPSAVAPSSVAAAPSLAAGRAQATAGAAAGSPPVSASHRLVAHGCGLPPLVATEPAAFGSPGSCPDVSNDRSPQEAMQLEQFTEPAEVQVWFEVSANTGRVHLHGAPDGSAPLRLSLPMEVLLAGDSPPLEELLEAVSLGGGPPLPVPAPAALAGQQWEQPVAQPAQEAAGLRATLPAACRQQQQQQQQQHGHAREVNEDQVAHPRQQQRPAVVGGIGVLAIDHQISAAKLAAMLAEAREFAAEWRELRGLHQSRLQGRVLRAPLTEAVEEVDRVAAAAGRLGVSTDRFVNTQRADLALPPGADWRMVRVAFKRYGKECEYRQPFAPDGTRLCINCAKSVPGKAAAQPADTTLDSMAPLFCSGECEGRFALKSNGSAYRRALFRLERGVCVKCRLDCHALVKRLQAVEKGSRDWEEQRRRIVAARASRLAERGYKAHLDLLVRRAVEGNAWQADHILPVYKGGGLCDVDNLRTLCVACHADVTKDQAKERAAERRQAKAAAANGGCQLGWEDVAREGGQPVVRRRKKLQRTFLDADGPGDAQGQPAAAAAAQGKLAVAAAAGATGAGPAAGAAVPSEQGVLQRRRKRLKSLFAESDSGCMELDALAATGQAQPGVAQPTAAADAARQAGNPRMASRLAQRAQVRPRGRLKPLFVGPGEDQPENGAAATPAAVGGDPAAGTARSCHRLARSSTAEEPEGVKLQLQAANAGAGALGNGAANRRPRSAAAEAEDATRMLAGQ